MHENGEIVYLTIEIIDEVNDQNRLDFSSELNINEEDEE